MINGTDSTIWHPYVTKDELIYTFMNDICRSVYLKFNQTRENSFDINTYRYTLPDEAFANSSDNEGFCLSDKTQRLECLPNGLFSLSSCVHCKYMMRRKAQEFFDVFIILSIKKRDYLFSEW
jgi:hypothetical protein